MFGLQPTMAILGAVGIVLGAWYLLRLLQRVFFGPLKEPPHERPEPVQDLHLRELAALVPIAALCLLIGVYPQPILKTAERELEIVVRITDEAAARTRTMQLAGVRAGANRKEQGAKSQ